MTPIFLSKGFDKMDNNLKGITVVDAEYHLASSIFTTNDLNRSGAPEPDNYIEEELKSISKIFSYISYDNMEFILSSIENILNAKFNIINNSDDYCFYMILECINIVRFEDDNFTIGIWTDRARDQADEDYLKLREELSPRIYRILNNYNDELGRALTKDGYMLAIDVCVFIKGMPFKILQYEK